MSFTPGLAKHQDRARPGTQSPSFQSDPFLSSSQKPFFFFSHGGLTLRRSSKFCRSVVGGGAGLQGVGRVRALLGSSGAASRAPAMREKQLDKLADLLDILLTRNCMHPTSRKHQQVECGFKTFSDNQVLSSLRRGKSSWSYLLAGKQVRGCPAL